MPERVRWFKRRTGGLIFGRYPKKELELRSYQTIDIKPRHVSD